MREKECFLTGVSGTGEDRASLPIASTNTGQYFEKEVTEEKDIAEFSDIFNVDSSGETSNSRDSPKEKEKSSAALKKRFKRQEKEEKEQKLRKLNTQQPGGEASEKRITRSESLQALKEYISQQQITCW